MGEPNSVTIQEMPLNFARLLYPLHSIPFLIKHNDMHRIHKAMISLVWLNKKLFIALSKCYLLKSEDRANLLNIREYNLACLLRNGLD